MKPGDHHEASYQLALLGHPVAHSKSPAIHQSFAEQTGVSIQYDLIDTAPDELSGRLSQVWQEGYHGLNLTLPLKEIALSCVASVAASAQQAGAANTLVRTHDGWQAHNTDGIGFIRDLQSKANKTLMQDARILILGAGGAVRGLLPELLNKNPSRIDIVNRTLARAENLAAFDTRVHAHAWDTWAQGKSGVLTTKAYDLIVDAALPQAWTDTAQIWMPSICQPHTIAYSLNYGTRAQAFLKQAKLAGISTCFDGMGMLNGQAASAFYIWTGFQPHI